MCQKEANSSQWKHQWVLVSHKWKRTLWKIWQLTNTHTLIYTKWLCKSCFFEVDGGVNDMMESSHSARVEKCVASLMFACTLSQGDGPCLNFILTSLFHTGTSCKAQEPWSDTQHCHFLMDNGCRAQELSLRARWAHPMHKAGDMGILPFSSQNYLFI